jgi:hypothetical protein
VRGSERPKDLRGLKLVWRVFEGSFASIDRIFVVTCEGMGEGAYD